MIRTDCPFQTFMFEPKQGWSCPFPALDSPQTLVVAFGASSLIDDPAPMTELRRAFPSSHLIGCSTSGQFVGDRLFDGGIAVSLFRFRRTRLATAYAPIRSAEDSVRAGDTLARQLAGPDLRAVFVLSDGLNINGSELIRGLSASLPQSVVITGGLAGDGDRFKRTWVLRNGCPESGFVTAVGFHGRHIRIGHGSQGGWDVFGPERIVTRAKGNVLYELDNEPALPLYKRYLGELASGLPSTALLFPLAVRPARQSDHPIVRTVLGVNEQDGSMTFAGDITEGHLAQLMRANFDRLISASAESAKTASEASPCLAIAVSCVGRRLILGERTEEELNAVLESLPAGSQVAGYYSYGEISPSGIGDCGLHNQTMTLTTFSET